MIAFVDGAESDRIHVVELDPDGSPVGEKISIDCPEGISGVGRLAGWTPDNVLAAVGAPPTEFALFAQPMEGGKARFLAHGGYPTQPRWSPDGQRIFHVNQTDSTSGDWGRLAIAYLSSEGGDVTRVPLQSETKISLFAYGAGSRVSPDGQTIVFAGHEQGEEGNTMHIWTLPVEGGKPRQLTDEPLMDWYPAWSPDGRSIAFVRVTPSENWADIGKANIFILPANGGEARQVTSETDRVFDAGPVIWSPDGNSLAYFSRDKDDTDSGTIKIIPAGGGEPRPVTKVQWIFANKELAWSPDGRRIAFNASPPGPSPNNDPNLIKIVSLDDGSIEEIVPDLENVEAIYHLDWSPDGKTLVFGGYMGGGPELWLISDFLPEGR
jgi:Tol biopolymer transport system component